MKNAKTENPIYNCLYPVPSTKTIIKNELAASKIVVSKAAIVENDRILTRNAQNKNPVSTTEETMTICVRYSG